MVSGREDATSYVQRGAVFPRRSKTLQVESLIFAC